MLNCNSLQCLSGFTITDDGEKKIIGKRYIMMAIEGKLRVWSIDRSRMKA